MMTEKMRKYCDLHSCIAGRVIYNEELSDMNEEDYQAIMSGSLQILLALSIFLLLQVWI